MVKKNAVLRQCFSKSTSTGQAIKAWRPAVVAFAELVLSAFPSGASAFNGKNRRLIVLDNQPHLVILIFLTRGNCNAKAVCDWGPL